MEVRAVVPDNRLPVPAVPVASVGDVLDALSDAVALLDADGQVVAVNAQWRAFGRLNGADPATTGVGVSYLGVCDAAAAAGSDDGAQVASGIRALLAPGAGPASVELVYPCHAPHVERWFTVRLTPVPPPVGGVLLCHRDISVQRGLAAELERRAFEDGLTGLANRASFLLRLGAALAPGSGPGPGAAVGVVYIDLDGFKAVNDIFGHAAGDGVLRTVADRLVRQSRISDTVARLGGDEFAMVLPDVTEDDLAQAVTRIAGALSEPHRLELGSVVVRASVGTYLGRPGDHVTSALHRADEAMYTVKRSDPRRGLVPPGPRRDQPPSG